MVNMLIKKSCISQISIIYPSHIPFTFPIILLASYINPPYLLIFYLDFCTSPLVGLPGSALISIQSIRSIASKLLNISCRLYPFFAQNHSIVSQLIYRKSQSLHYTLKAYNIASPTTLLLSSEILF